MTSTKACYTFSVAHTTAARKLERPHHVKGSTFIALVTPLSELAEVETHLREVRERYPDASHWCYAYKLGSAVRFSDDGEPGGTAGRPMLEIFNKRGLDYVLGVVTRYFGGTKLGAGGLVRAYSGSLAKALDEAGTYHVQDRSELHFEVPFAAMDTVHRLLDSWPALHKSDPAYSATGLRLSVTLLAADVTRLKKQLETSTSGEVKWREKK